MRIGVFINSVMHIESKLMVEDGCKLVNKNKKYDFNAYDLYALEEALRIGENYENEDVEVICIAIGDENSKDVIMNALAIGADSGIYIDDYNAELTTSNIASILKDIFISKNIDLIITGKEIVDKKIIGLVDYLGGILDISSVDSVIKLQLTNKKLCVDKQLAEGTHQVIKCNLPAIIGVTKGINIPRYPTLRDIMKARKKNVETLKAKDRENISASIECVTRIINNNKKKCNLITNEQEDNMELFVSILKNSIKNV
ncbi:electron transfer flavoprotein subunit beta/FixA family protein [Clostridium akagii]|uniref:electron transfer flavoprotein subunit beta/FixA family protein n=1 Tax=Clostridium akagii TaxID=91623 RepID=UPI00047C7517|nr:hypothetical protein [Clostridium akagii]